MPDSLDDLLALLDLETIEDNLFRGRQPRTRLQRVFGGQVAGQALMAALRTVPAERTAHSLHAYFLRPGDTTVPIVYDVELVRDGRSFTTRRVVARQHGRPIFYLTASFHTAEEGLEHQDVMPPSPPPDECPRLGDLMAQVSGEPTTAWDQEWASLDVRYVGDSRPGGGVTSPDHPALARLWFRASGHLPDDPSLHSCVLTYASDLTLLGAALVPHGTYVGAPDTQLASLDHTMWFHRPFRADEWLLYDQVAPSAYGARGLALGRVFTEDGRLVATIAQEGLIRKLDVTA
ncbi:acyl-CoA thioesterase II [Phytoactinopolyspora alkaliphila]|uniref:Acyl-CoA thioesterase 2 n=1 Tax=Phytoactinopolyspora alkaliphila TaxID=1783498 RepID=A0A6N9YSW3_9ACTN|nr:acyl-CoA thioesterase II [Phytoactinopolyspora alkaliphila]